MKTELNNFLETLGYRFQNEEILKIALNHSSYSNENKSKRIQNNERLEFLGDSVLSLIVSNHIFRKYSELPEGEMTKIRASVVCESTLKELAMDLDIGSFIKLGKGEELTGGRNRPSILSDAYEAVVGAIYIDGGYKQAESFVLKQMIELIENSAQGFGIADFKTKLQEILQKKGDTKISYEVVEELGPDHSKEYTVLVRCDGEKFGIGMGKSKKEAEQNAARNALKMVKDKR